MAEIIDFKEAREKRDNPESLKTGDVCYLRGSNNLVTETKVRVVTVKGTEAVVRMEVANFANVDGFIFQLLPNGKTIELNHSTIETTVKIAFLKKV